MTTTIDQKLIDLLNQWTINGWPIGNFFLVLIALLLSLVLCGMIGLEREIRGRSAGLRTHLLVGMGSCIVMIISIYGFPSSAESHRDVARLAAQVISGVGFLGAGAIIYHNATAKGLTTAGTIWLSMAVGLACGSMNFLLAITATIMIMFVVITLRRVERKIAMKNPLVHLVVPVDVSVMSVVLDICEKHGCKITPISMEKFEEDQKEKIDFLFRLLSDQPIETAPLAEELRQATNAYSIQIATHN